MSRSYGGELTMDRLEIRYDPVSRISEASLQMKSNNGTLLIDDFGRQRMQPVELLNRWIVPLEKRYDFLSLANGKKIRVPFDQLILFSTNLEPKQLVDEAFLRRIPYKINAADPSRAVADSRCDGRAETSRSRERTNSTVTTVVTRNPSTRSYRCCPSRCSTRDGTTRHRRRRETTTAVRC